MKNSKTVFSGYNPDNAKNFLYTPNSADIQKEAIMLRHTQSIRPSVGDKHKIGLLLIDAQRDFCHPEGSLYVAGRSGVGAIEDSKRISEFIYNNLEQITNIIATLDTHYPWQIFFSNFWVKKNTGEAINPHTLIDVEEKSGRNYLVNKDLGGNILCEVEPHPAVSGILNVPPSWLINQCIHYCSQLANPAQGRSKYTLYLWPLHCLMSSVGHTLVGVIHEAMLFHAFIRSSQSQFEIKGGHPLTENYSIVQPEVLTRFDGKMLAERNVKFLKHLLEHDIVVIGGQASSHCVASSIDDILLEILANDKTLAEKVYILRDCTSAVVVPGADFTDQAEAALARFEAHGMHIVNSTDPIGSWPGIAGSLFS